MSSNYEPTIKGTDWGIWRRINRIPFEVTITEDLRDDHLAEKLKGEAAGIFNWMLAGLSQYLTSGLNCREKVKEATSRYRESQDVVGRFLADKCIFSEGAELKAANA